MAPETGTALLIIGAFVLPGFVTLLFRERTHLIKGKDPSFERLLHALYYSSIIYVVIGTVLWSTGRDREDVTRFFDGRMEIEVYLAVAALALFLLPLAIAETGRYWQKSKKFRPWVLKRFGVDQGHSVPAGWEQLFRESPGALGERGLMLRVTTRDGRVVGGFFGRSSLADYTTQTRDLFIEERWILDEPDSWFQRPADSTGGIWIAEDQIASVEAYIPTDPGLE